MLSLLHNLFAVKLLQKTNDPKENFKIQSLEEKEMLKILAKNARNNCFNGNVQSQLFAVSKINEIMSTKVALVTSYGAVSICSNLCQNGSPQVIQSMASLLKTIIHSSDPVINLLGLNAIFYATKRPELIPIVIDRNIVKQLAQLCKHSDKDVKMAAFITLAKIFEGDYMKAAINAGIIKLLPHFLASEEMQLKMEALNICLKIVSSGTRDNVITVIRANIIPHLCSILERNDEKLFGTVLTILNDILQKSGTMSSNVCKIIRKSGSAEILKNFINNNKSLQNNFEKLF